MNLPKLISEDIPLFLGLIKDLFTGVVCPHIGHPDFSEAVKTVLSEEDFVVLPEQVSFSVPYNNISSG